MSTLSLQRASSANGGCSPLIGCPGCHSQVGKRNLRSFPGLNRIFGRLSARACGLETRSWTLLGLPDPSCWGICSCTRCKPARGMELKCVPLRSSTSCFSVTVANVNVQREVVEPPAAAGRCCGMKPLASRPLRQKQRAEAGLATSHGHGRCRSSGEPERPLAGASRVSSRAATTTARKLLHSCRGEPAPSASVQQSLPRPERVACKAVLPAQETRFGMTFQRSEPASKQQPGPAARLPTSRLERLNTAADAPGRAGPGRSEWELPPSLLVVVVAAVAVVGVVVVAGGADGRLSRQASSGCQALSRTPCKAQRRPSPDGRDEAPRSERRRNMWRTHLPWVEVKRKGGG